MNRISYQDAEKIDEEILKRWLIWAVKGDPSEERILETSLKNKGQILAALVWVGAITYNET